MFDSHIDLPCRTPAVLRPCRLASDFSRPRHSTAWARHAMCELTSAVSRRPVGDLPNFGFFRLPRGVLRLAFRVFPGYTRTFTKDTAVSEDGRNTARYAWIHLKCLIHNTQLRKTLKYNLWAFINDKRTQYTFGYLRNQLQKREGQLGATNASRQLIGINICIRYSCTLARYMFRPSDLPRLDPLTIPRPRVQSMWLTATWLLPPTY